jgi:hypothetical protein
VIASIHLADIGAQETPGVLRRRLHPDVVPGLRYAVSTFAVPLGGGLLPRPQLGRVGLIAAWEDDAALDRFLESHPLARQLRGGWHVRLEPLRVSGAWAGLRGLPTRERPVEDGEPVAVLTLGQLRLRRTAAFLQASSRAESLAVSDPAVLEATGLARPPRLVATFSLWRTAAAMRAYAYGETGEGHRGAIRAHAARSFHHESAFLRFRPYAAQGVWNGRDPLSTAI